MLKLGFRSQMAKMGEITKMRQMQQKITEYGPMEKQKLIVHGHGYGTFNYETMQGDRRRSNTRNYCS